MAQKFVRVRLENGTEKSVPETVAQTAGYKILDKPARGRDLRVLPDKPRVDLGASSAKKKSTTEADASHEASKEG